MLFEELARAVVEVESTSSRRKMVELAAALLEQADPAEVGPIVYFLQGQLAPPYEGIEPGLGEKLLIASLAEAYEVEPAAVAKRMAKAGDLGLVAESLATRSPARRLTVKQVHDALLEIAAVQGSGSVAGKTSRMVALLGRVGGVEAKLLVRVVQGRLRTGMGDQTLLEAAAQAALGEVKEKKLLEHAYNVRSDLGSVIRLAFEKGKRGLVALGPDVGVPVRPALAQRLASPMEIITRLGRVLVEPKYDGLRLQCHRDGETVSIFSRRLENVTDMFPDLARALKKQLRTKRAIIEGEALAHDPSTGEYLPFQMTVTRKRKSGIDEAARRYPLRLFAFDLLYAGRESYLAEPQLARTERLRELLHFGADDPVQMAESLVTSDPEEVEKFFDEMVTRGLEGILAKRTDAPYRAGARGYHWVKLKRAYQSQLRDTVDLVLVGFLRGRGKRVSLGIGSLLGAVYDPKGDRFRTVAKIGSGLSDRAWKEIRGELERSESQARPARVDSVITPDVWVEPKVVVEVLADEITRSPLHTCGKSDHEPGYALRFPRIVGGVRADKGPEDATTEKEIIELYRLQRRAPVKAGSVAAKR